MERVHVWPQDLWQYHICTVVQGAEQTRAADVPPVTTSGSPENPASLIGISETGNVELGKVHARDVEIQCLEGIGNIPFCAVTVRAGLDHSLHSIVEVLGSDVKFVASPINHDTTKIRSSVALVSSHNRQEWTIWKRKVGKGTDDPTSLDLLLLLGLESLA